MLQYNPFAVPISADIAKITSCSVLKNKKLANIQIMKSRMRKGLSSRFPSTLNF